MLRKTPLRKRGKSTRSKLIADLDTAFSQYIRLRDADNDGYCTCCTCGARLPWKEIQAGHYVSRRQMATKYDPQNVHAQCFVCNVRKRGNMAKYARFMKATYGQDIIDAIVIASEQVRRIRTAELREMVAHYQGEVERMQEALNEVQL